MKRRIDFQWQWTMVCTITGQWSSTKQTFTNHGQLYPKKVRVTKQNYLQHLPKSWWNNHSIDVLSESLQNALRIVSFILNFGQLKRMHSSLLSPWTTFDWLVNDQSRNWMNCIASQWLFSPQILDSFLQQMLFNKHAPSQNLCKQN